MLFGKKIRELRDEHDVLQRQLAALLEIDTPTFSKIERGDRRAKRDLYNDAIIVAQEQIKAL